MAAIPIDTDGVRAMRGRVPPLRIAASDRRVTTGCRLPPVKELIRKRNQRLYTFSIPDASLYLFEVKSNSPLTSSASDDVSSGGYLYTCIALGPSLHQLETMNSELAPLCVGAKYKLVSDNAPEGCRVGELRFMQRSSAYKATDNNRVWKLTFFIFDRPISDTE